MPITKINFSTSLEYANPHSGLRSWKKFGAEYEIIDNENLETAKKILKDFVYESLKKQPDEIVDVVKVDEKFGSENIIELINKCKSIAKPNGIMAYEFLANTDAEIKKAFDKKLKELNKKSKIEMP